MPSSIYLHPARLSVQSLSSLAKRFSTARFLYNLPASLSQPARRVMEQPVEAKVFPEAKVAAVDHLDVAADAHVDVEPEVAVAIVVPVARKELRFLLLRSSH
jgi:hypothetical protein